MTKFKMEQYSKEVGRGYTVRVVDAKNPQVGLSKQYDVELVYKNDRLVTNLSKGCIGDKSAEYWYGYNLKIVTRLMFLLDGKDMAIHNAMCYGKHWGGEPKDGYEEKWQTEIDKENMLEEWIDELLQFSGKGEKYEILKREFCIE